MEPLVYGRPVAGLTGCSHGQSVIDKLYRTLLRLLNVAPAQAVRKVQKALHPCGTADKQVPEVLSHGGDEILGIEALGQHLVEQQESALVV